MHSSRTHSSNTKRYYHILSCFSNYLTGPHRWVCQFCGGMGHVNRLSSAAVVAPKGARKAVAGSGKSLGFDPQKRQSQGIEGSRNLKRHFFGHAFYQLI